MGTAANQSASLKAQNAAGPEALHATSAPGADSQIANPDPFSRAGRDRLVRLAYRFLWNQADAEDVAQDALSIAHAKSAEVREPSRRWSWMCRIVVRQCQTGLRAKSRWRRHEPLLARERSATETNSAESSTSGDLKEAIRRLLRELPPRQREVLVLKHLEGMGFEQIAETLEISPATARVHAHAGRERLRELIRERHGELLVE